MKLIEEKGTVERSGDFQEGVFKIAASAKAFDILSSKLYSDIPRAIVRELSTNAYDSHVSVGKADKPFKVHLPTSLESWFAIRDFGSGLSEEDVREIYTTYFASTRNQSDEFTGCLGLGSKSPFAYTDNFTVTSYVDGKANTYSLFKNESGCPSIALLNSADTDEENGLEVKIDVKWKDMAAFAKAAGTVYYFFKVTPICTGLQLPSEEVKVKGKDYAIVTSTYTYSPSIQVVMGQVCYNVGDTIKIDNPFSGNYTTIRLHVDVGDCSITASREELHMDSRTCQRVEKALKDAYEDIKKRGNAQMAKATNDLDKKIIENKYNHIITMRQATDLRWHKDNSWSAALVDVFNGRLVTRSGDNYYINRAEERPYIIEYSDTDDFVKSGIRNRVKHFIQTANLKSNQQCWVVRILDKKKFAETFGAVDIHADNLPKPLRAKKDPSIPNTREYWFIETGNRTGNWQRDNKWDDSTPNTAIVMRQHYAAEHGAWSYDVDAICRMMEPLGIKRVYGLPPAQFKRYKGKLKSLFDILKSKIEHDLAKLSDAEISAISYHSNSMMRSTNFSNVVAHLSDTLTNYHDMMVADHRSDFVFIRNYIHRVGIKLRPVPNYAEECRKQYPLLAYISSGHFVECDKEFMKEIKDYIKSKESK